MFRDLGFIMLIITDLFKGVAVALFFISCFTMHVAPSPWNYISLAYVLAVFIFILLPMTKEVLEMRYQSYLRDKQKEAIKSQ